jgi:hypothetical protein
VNFIVSLRELGFRGEINAPDKLSIIVSAIYLQMKGLLSRNLERYKSVLLVK